MTYKIDSINEYCKLAENTRPNGEAAIDAVARSMKVAPQVGQLLVQTQKLSVLADALKRHIYYGDIRQTVLSDIQKIGEEDIDKTSLSQMETLLFNRLFHAWIGLLTETGEIAELLICAVQGAQSTYDLQNAAEEAGDAYWYLAEMLNALDLKGSVVLGANIAKLQERFPNKFKASDALNRNIEAEKKHLPG